MQRSKLESPLPESLQNASEGEQVDWRFGDNDEAFERFEEALKHGALQMLRGEGEVETTPATIYLPMSDMKLAAEQAELLGMDTATYLQRVVQMALHEKTAA